MEMNREEAEKCREIGKKHLRVGNYQQAIKFFDKSLRMYPLPGVDGMRDRAQRELENASAAASQQHARATSSSSSSSTARRRGATSNSSSDETTRSYTAEQVEIVQKIKACKTHYEVLSVPQSADENEIKKAYRKLALKLHPDKNSAPGAEDAFKAVGKAFTVLSDADKRAAYDKYGDDTPQTSGRNARRGGAYDDEMSPEELFNMFFGGGFHRPHRRTHFHTQAPRQHHPGTGQPQRFGPQQLMQLLPLFLIFLFSLISIPSSPDLPFSMHPTQQYNIHRTTQMSHVAKGIPYYVDESFDRKYSRQWREMARIEQLVEQIHINRLEESCQNQKLKQKQMIYRARNSNAIDKEAAMRAALELKMPACEQLRSLQRTRF